MAGTLWPESHWPSLCRGLVLLEQGNDRRAIAAFDDVIRLRPETEVAYYNRALAKSHIGDLAGAEADVTVLLDRSGPSVRGYFLRAGIRRRRRNREGARPRSRGGLAGEAARRARLDGAGPREAASRPAGRPGGLRRRPHAQSALSDGPPEQGQRPGREPRAHRGGPRDPRNPDLVPPRPCAGHRRPGRPERTARPPRGRARRRCATRCGAMRNPISFIRSPASTR